MLEGDSLGAELSCRADSSDGKRAFEFRRSRRQEMFSGLLYLNTLFTAIIIGAIITFFAGIF